MVMVEVALSLLLATNSLILSYKYHCHSNDRPSGVTKSGRLWQDTFQVGSFSMLICFSSSPLAFLTNTTPGELCVNLKWWLLLMPFSTVLTYGGWSNHSSCKLAQSIVHLVSGTFTTEQLSTAAAMLCSVLIFIQHKCCLKRPNHQSSTNVECLTGRKEIIIFLWSLVSTHNIR